MTVQSDNGEKVGIIHAEISLKLFLVIIIVEIALNLLV